MQTFGVRSLAAAMVVAAAPWLPGCASADPPGAPEAGRSESPHAEQTGVAASLDAIDARLREMADAGRFSGVVAVAKDGELVFEGAYGEADRSRGIPNTTATQFNLASIGKTFTGVAVTQLAEAGALDLHAPVGTYLPWLPDAIGSRVTIEHLLTHTAGLHDFFRHPRYERLEPELTSVDAYRPFIVGDRPEFRPGARFMYSNSGYVLLGMVIEEVSGQDYYDYVQEHVFDVAGMSDTGFYGPDDRSPGRAVGYSRTRGELEENWSSLPPRGSPAGGAYSTVHDMLAFSEALWDNRLLSPRFTKLATTSQFREPQGGYGYGFGIRKGRPGDPPSIGHNGGAPGIASELTMNRGLGYDVVILSNFDPQVAAEAVDLILNGLQIP